MLKGSCMNSFWLLTHNTTSFANMHVFCICIAVLDKNVTSSWCSYAAQDILKVTLAWTEGDSAMEGYTRWAYRYGMLICKQLCEQSHVRICKKVSNRWVDMLKWINVSVIILIQINQYSFYMLMRYKLCQHVLIALWIEGIHFFLANICIS